MRRQLRWFNVNLGVAAIAWLALGGCQTARQQKPVANIRFHLEVNQETPGQSEEVPVLRGQPIMVNVLKQHFLDESAVQKATVVDVLGSYAVRLQFNDHGRIVLETVSTSYRGKRAAIHARFQQEDRWIAAPRFFERITNGVFTFTPDTSRAEAEALAEGLNRLARKNGNASAR